MQGHTARRAYLPWALALLGGCSSPPKLQGAGGSCIQVTDCAPGLVCVPQAGSLDGPRHCSSDTSTLVSTEGASDAAGGSGLDASEAATSGDEVTPDAIAE